jgi:uncharacterized protein (TIGR04255 family)
VPPKPPQRKQFKKPPLVEVFCEFFFEMPAGVEWDWFTVPTFYRNVRKEFPTRKQIATVGIEFRVAGGAIPPEVERVGPPTPRHRFISENGKTLVQLGENLLVVNQLPPYYGWERYEPIVAECFALYTRMWKPKNVARAAVHYIDKVDIPKLDVGIEEYFNLYPRLPDFPDSPATNVTVAYEVQGAAEGDILATTMRQHPSANPEGICFMLQWDYVATGGLPARPAEVKTWLNAAHAFMSEAFRSALTPECLKLFDPED